VSKYSAVSVHFSSVLRHTLSSDKAAILHWNAAVRISTNKINMLY